MRMKKSLVVSSVLAEVLSRAPIALGQGSSELLKIYEELVDLRKPQPVAEVPDYSAAAMEAQRTGLAALRRRLDALNPAGWPVADKVDYQLVRAQMDDLDFRHRLVRPWARDPGFYVDLVKRVAYRELPVPAERMTEFQKELQAVPRILEQARGNLSAGSSELARMAIFHLDKSDGVNQGEPRRPVPPEGVIGWYRDLLERLPKYHPDLLADARQALAAVEGYRNWLRQTEGRMSAPAWVGLDNYNWYLKHVRLMPFTAEEVRLIGEREIGRARTFLEIEENKNRNLPKLEPVTTAEEHERRLREGETLIRSFIQREGLLTLPEDLPPAFETDAFFIVRPGGHRHFWEEIGYRDVLNNHLHASIPGHRFDALLQRRNPRPIRRDYRDGARGEGWGFYIEEMFLQAGLLAERPRARELFYIAQLKRAVRIPAELRMQTGEYTLQQAVDFMIDQVPLMEENLARYDLEGYLRQPTYGMNYFMGKVELERLLSERAQQLGDRFHLGRFHDEFLSAGSIPISLIRWEMTGRDDEIKKLTGIGN